MEEAEILSDRVALLSKGVLRVHGSPLFLKARFGAGYLLSVAVEGEDVLETTAVDMAELIRNKVPSAVVGQPVATQHGAVVHATLPLSGVSHFPSLFRILEAPSVRETHGVVEYGLTSTTLEQVFLKLAEEEEQEEEEAKASIGLHGEL